MGTPHNAAERGEIASTVLMPGDPLRAKYIADTYPSESIRMNFIIGMRWRQSYGLALPAR